MPKGLAIRAAIISSNKRYKDRSSAGKRRKKKKDRRTDGQKERKKDRQKPMKWRMNEKQAHEDNSHVRLKLTNKRRKQV